MPNFKINNSKAPDFDKMSYEEEVSFWDAQGDWTKFADMPDQSKEEIVNFRIPSKLKKRLKAIARRSDRSVSSLLRVWTLEKLGKIKEPNKLTIG